MHYRALKQAIKYGLTLRKIYRVLQFNQSPWMRPFVELNTKLRGEAKSKFEQDLIKLMTNSIFGKTLENPEKRVDVKIITNWHNIGKKYGASVLISKPTFDSCSIFNSNMVGIQMKKFQIKYDRPCYIGFTVLDVAKTILYDFHYGYVKKKYGEKAVKLYGDTDSLFYQIFCKDFYADMLQNIDKFDTSNFEENNKYGIPQVNKKKLKKMKDELGGDLFLEFIGLRSKTYYIRCENDKKSKKTCKGVQKAVVQNTVSGGDYYDCITIENKKIMRKMCVFRARKHTIFTQVQNKLALEFKDDKRYQVAGTWKTLPWGHYSLD